MPPGPASSPLPPIPNDLFPAEEGELTAAEQFSRWHGRFAHDPTPSRYRHLIPLAAPGPLGQYAFEVDLDRCSGCKACVTACHSLNGLDDDEAWRSVGLLIASPSPDPTSVSPASVLAPFPSPTLRHVTTACHHCLDPACLSGCPVLAYDKDPVTGIVRHLDDQCIGCRYCVMTCPYEVPRFSRRLGIVRKCDLCHGRLAAGEAPACAQACPNEAIRITLARAEDIRARHLPGPPAPGTPARHTFLPSSPDPLLTLPSTRFVSLRVADRPMRAVDQDQARPAESHLPLVTMLVLTQAAAGALLVPPLAVTQATPALRGLATGALLVGLAASVLHLGQPLRAWRVFLGWRQSWLSREALLLGGFAVAAIAATLLALVMPASPVLRLLDSITALLGIAGVTASVMVYVATRRPGWGWSETARRFGGTTLALGSALAWAAGSISGSAPPSIVWLGTLTVGVALGFGAEIQSWRAHRDPPGTALWRSAQLLRGPLRRRWRCRWMAAVAGWLVALHGLVAGGPALLVGSVGALILLTLGACLERRLFFEASSPDRMPGGLPDPS